MNNPEKPSAPFDMPEYMNENREKAKKLENEADEKSAAGREAIERACRYVLLTVIFASVLFFAGITTKFKAERIRIILLSLGGVLYPGSLITLPYQPIYQFCSSSF